MNRKRYALFEIQAEIGRGRSGIVYRSSDPDFKNELAVKVIPAFYFRDPAQRGMYEQEASIIALLKENAILPVNEIGEADGDLFIVMPFMKGGSLQDKLNQGPLSLEDTLRIFVRLSQALGSAHSAGIVHRDLKPTNILFDDKGEVYLSDFGMLKLSKVNPTGVGNLLSGASEYASPEEARGEFDIDARSDVYSLGVLLYQMLAGILPFSAGSAAEVALKHITQPVPNILSARPGLPKGTQKIIEKAMAKERDQRYQTVTDLLLAFWNLVRKDEPFFLQNMPENDTSDAGSKVWGKRLAWGIGAFLVLLLLGALAWWGGSGFPGWDRLQAMVFPKPATQVAVLTTETVTPTLAALTSFTPSPPATESVAGTPPVIPTAAQTPAPAATQTPGQQRKVIGGADKIAFLQENEIWIANIDGSELEPTFVDGKSKSNLRWTPDGEGITYLSDGDMMLYKPATKEKILLGRVDDLAISPDMSRVVVRKKVEFQNRVMQYRSFILEYVERELRLVTDRLTPNDPCVFEGGRLTQFSPDGERLASVVKISQGNSQPEVVQEFQMNETCDTRPQLLTNVPRGGFTIPYYNDSKGTLEIVDFAWNGDNLFLLHGDKDAGFGDLYLYDTEKQDGQRLNLIGGKCCYRDVRWSPDGTYLLLAFHDQQKVDNTRLYYIPFTMDESPQAYQPIPLPEHYFSDKSAPIEAALRIAQLP